MALDFEHDIAVNEYGFYCVPQAYKGRSIVDLLIDGGVYEPQTLRLLRRKLGGGDIVTGGAFIGDFLPALHQRLAPDAKIHTFEPVPTSFAATEETIRMNNLSQISFNNVGVGAEPGKMTMMVTRPNGTPIAAGERIVEGEDADGKRFIDIEVKTIDSLVPRTRQVSILHLDVEGFERPALEGAGRILNDSKPLVVLEGDKRWQKADYKALLNELAPKAGYHVAGSMENNTFYLPL